MFLGRLSQYSRLWYTFPADIVVLALIAPIEACSFWFSQFRLASAALYSVRVAWVVMGRQAREFNHNMVSVACSAIRADVEITWFLARIRATMTFEIKVFAANIADEVWTCRSLRTTKPWTAQLLVLSWIVDDWVTLHANHWLPVYSRVFFYYLRSHWLIQTLSFKESLHV